MKHKRGYSDEQEYAPNAGPADEKMGRDSRLKSIAEGHGTGMSFGKIGLHTNNAMVKDWGSSPGYGIEQRSDGSMDYLSVKDKQMEMDSNKVRRHMVKHDGKGSY